MFWRWLGGALLFVGAIAAFTLAWMVAVLLIALVLLGALVVYALSPKARRGAKISFSVSTRSRRPTVIEGEARRIEEQTTRE
jgi:membrane protein implicated in regulation of membrane protease activity